MKHKYNKEEFYKAHLSRDSRFDGKFFVAIKTTKIYCRPICPARKAKLENLEFYIHASQAEESGYRACLRCRPEAAPGSPAWIGTEATIRRAIRLMDQFALKNLSISNLAIKLGVSERWLRELFQQQIGTSPQSILLSKKLDAAKNLLDHSTLTITDIAFQSGFQSIRRFNDAFKKRFQKAPRDFRCKPYAPSSNDLRIQLSYRPPYAWNELLNFFSSRAIPGVEFVDSNTYQRLITYDKIRGWFKVTLGKKNHLNFEFKVDKNPNILEFITRLKNIFDLDCDPDSIETALKSDDKLKPFLKQPLGLRVPGCWDGFELAVRAIVGQKISVKATHTILGRLVKVCGEPQSLDESLKLTHFFPTPANIINSNLSNIGLTNSKIDAITSLANRVNNNEIILDGTANLSSTYKNLLSIKGIGKWTVDYINMRMLRDPNGFPITDLELQKKIIKLQLDPQKWIPWRAYAAILLWQIKL